ncbi:MAG TPA: winged helix-turn-helix domain-containing protein [Pyrinomonadaceae bacterium]|jgi:DNA-binding GntR family transcriptional regulator
MTRKVRVNRSGPESLTRQITDQLTNLIEAGALAAGSMLPSERTLADSLGVARNVVRRSYDYLMSGGYLESEGRRGKRVRQGSSKKSASRQASSAKGRKKSGGTAKPGRKGK